jgi:hypothetical protein
MNIRMESICRSKITIIDGIHREIATRLVDYACSCSLTNEIIEEIAPFNLEILPEDIYDIFLFRLEEH